MRPHPSALAGVPTGRPSKRVTGMTSGQSKFPISPSYFELAQYGEAGFYFSDLLPYTPETPGPPPGAPDHRGVSPFGHPALHSGAPWCPPGAPDHRDVSSRPPWLVTFRPPCPTLRSPLVSPGNSGV